MIWLLIKRENDYYIESPDTYGMETWGTDSQNSIYYKNGHWYFSYWRAGNDYIDDEDDEEEIDNIILETKDLDEVFTYLNNQNTSKETKLKILKKAKEEVLSHLSFTEWVINSFK